MPEESMNKSLSEQEQILFDIPNIIWETDIEGRTIFISPNITNILGYDPDEILSDKIKWFDMIHPRDKARVQTQYIKFFEKKHSFREEYQVLTKNNEWIWVLNTAH